MTADLVSGVLGGSVAGALVAWFIAGKLIYSQDVVQQREKWRDFMRGKTIEAVKAMETNDWHKISIIRNELQLRLHPKDRHDEAILDDLCRCDIENFTGRMAVLLKYDWEKAKIESNWWRSIFYKVKRPEYSKNKGRYIWHEECIFTQRIIVAISLFIILLWIGEFFPGNSVKTRIGEWLEVTGESMQSSANPK